MSIHGKLDIIRSLDYLLYCHFVYNYFLDGSLLILIGRTCFQVQQLATISFAHSIRTSVGIVTASLGLCILLHAIAEPGQPGLLIDFIGNQERPSRLRIIILDLIIYVLQVMRILISSSLSSQILADSADILTTLLMPASIASALNSTPDSTSPSSSIRNRNRNDQTQSSDGNGDDNNDDDEMFYQNDLVVDLSFRASLNQVLRTNDELPIDRLPV